MSQSRVKVETIPGKRLLALAAGALVSVSASGQAVVDPGTQPFYTLAPYVLESSNLEVRPGNPEGGTYAYRPWFENGAWTGDLIQYRIDKDGRREFSGGVLGLYPRDGDGWNAMGELWTARYVFPDFQPYNLLEEFSPTWECIEENESYWLGRNVFTVNETGNQVEFLWPELGANQQEVIDPITFALQNEAGREALKTDDYASDTLNYLRGDRSFENCKQGGKFRMRFSLLGSIVNSRPVYVPTGEPGIVVVGANDGMLHAFQAGPRSAGGGSELWAYIPSVLLDDIRTLRLEEFQPRYFVDGELRAANVGSLSEPQHIVAGGLGAGGKGLFVLDVTSPTAPVISEFFGESGSHIAANAYHEHLGQIHGRPTIAKLPDGNTYVVSGNGFGSGEARLILVKINSDGTAGALQALPTDFAGDNGLSPPALVDVNGDGAADYAYAGDIKGHLWRFDLETYQATLLFHTGATATDYSHPITVEPEIARHPEDAPGYMIYFGTGSLLSADDAQDPTRQWVYGIWDRGDGATVGTGQLVPQYLVTAEVTWDVAEEAPVCPPLSPGETRPDSNTVYVRFAQDTDTYPNWTKDNPDLGWKVELPRDGERLIGRPQVRAERLQFITTNPYDMASGTLISDPGNGSWVLQLNLATGANSRLQARALYDHNENCLLDALDGLPPDTEIDDVQAGQFPVGVNIGPINVAQPAFARVAYNTSIGSVVDGVYINALQLPEIEPQIGEVSLHGPIDVTTDSPRGPEHRQPVLPDGTPAPEAVKADFNVRDFPESSGPTKPFVRADGIGHRADGHSFAYNKHHGVDYVDIFMLEPQRGGFGSLGYPVAPSEPPNNYRLDIGATYYDSTTDEFELIPFHTPTAQELNRVTEVLEDRDKEFIVVLANADLSQANIIQIGCTIWPVYDYQTQMMGYLRANNIGGLKNDGFVFSLNSITGAGSCTGGGEYSEYLSERPTIRITPVVRVGTPKATLGTLPGCVINTDRYVGSSGSIYLTRKSQLDSEGNFVAGATPADLYEVDPHATAAYVPGPGKKNPPEWTGYRWRNGALTLQLLSYPDFVLQPDGLPNTSGIEGEDEGFGGAYAKAFTIESDGALIPLNNGVSPPGTDAETSGLLYEMSMFWHWGDSARGQSAGASQQVSPSCLGTQEYKPFQTREGDWMNFGYYQKITDELEGNIPLQQRYLSLVALSRSGDADALQQLWEMFKEFPSIAEYHRMRHYVLNSSKLEGKLIEIDRGEVTFELEADGTPAPVSDIEADLLPSLGPNYRPGRRSWIDIAPE